MKRQPSDLESRRFNLAIIGGGITGAWMALDAALRGMTVALVERDDFGAATSAASSKLLHGGIRYLARGRVAKVRESAIERARAQSAAPHLTRWVPFVIPAYAGLRRGRAALASALALYEMLCLGQNRRIQDPCKRAAAGRVLGAQDMRKLVPYLSGSRPTGGILIHESHMYSPERVTLAVVRTAVCRGAVAANHVSADAFRVEDGRVTGVQATDRLTCERLRIRADVVVNAAGPWIPFVDGGLPAPAPPGIHRHFARGTHIITRPLTEEHALVLPSRHDHDAVISRGGRHLFVIPWRGRSLIGTSYAPHGGHPDDVRPLESDIEQLLTGVNAALGTRELTRADVDHAFAGLYPLPDGVAPGTYHTGGDYRVIDHRRHQAIDGLYSVCGARYTTARRLAERALNRINGRFGGRFDRCRTGRLALHGGAITDMTRFHADAARRHGPALGADVVEHLVASYGTQIDDVLAPIRAAPELGERVGPQTPVILAEVTYAVQQEMACHLADFVFRRSGLGTLGDPGEAAIDRCARLMGRELGWHRERRDLEIRRTRAAFPGDGSSPPGQ